MYYYCAVKSCIISVCYVLICRYRKKVLTMKLTDINIFTLSVHNYLLLQWHYVKCIFDKQNELTFNLAPNSSVAEQCVCYYYFDKI